MNLELLENWAPFRLLFRQGECKVDWAWLGRERFTDPFFEQTISHCLRHPANALFRHETSINTLKHLYEERPGIKPTGFIFHLSRCGSTLVAQILAAAARSIVISEARPIDQVIRANVDEEQRIQWLRWIINALAQRRRPDEQYIFVKFDAWHVLHWRLIQRAFPDTPAIFLYRDPLEIMVSQQRERGVQMIPGALDPSAFGLDPREPWFTRLDEYAARVLATLCEAALEQHAAGLSVLVNFHQLPQVVPDSLLEYFGVQFTGEELSRLHQAAGFDAKRPGLPYKNDVIAKQQAAKDEMRHLSDEIDRPFYDRLEAARQAQLLKPARQRLAPPGSTGASNH